MQGNQSSGTSDAEGELLDQKAAADFLGVSVRRLHRLRQKGEIPAIRLGWRRWQFRQSDLMAYVEKSASGNNIPQTGTPNTVASEPPAAPTRREEFFKLMSELGPPEHEQDEECIISDGSPLIRLANAILAAAIDASSSDIHIEPDARNLRVRCRIDGRMTELMMIPKHVQYALLNRYKIMADLNPFDKRPGLGFIPIKHNNQEYNLRVSTLPSAYGETVVMRVLEQTTPRCIWETLGIAPDDVVCLEHLMQEPSGLILLAGSPGSGRTTTAYSLLWRLNSIEKNIISLEEIREYGLAGITQSYADARRDVTRARLLENALTQDPDIIFLGDLNDTKAVRTAMECAAGTLTIATLNARDSVDALRRLMGERGVSPFQAGRVVSGVLAQHLVRKICPECAGKGCESCRNRGYKGRTGVFELLQMNEEIAELIRRDAPLLDLYDAARANGMTPLREEAMRLIENGRISDVEFARTLGQRDWYSRFTNRTWYTP